MTKNASHAHTASAHPDDYNFSPIAIDSQHYPRPFGSSYRSPSPSRSQSQFGRYWRSRSRSPRLIAQESLPSREYEKYPNMKAFFVSLKNEDEEDDEENLWTERFHWFKGCTLDLLPTLSDEELHGTMQSSEGRQNKFLAFRLIKAIREKLPKPKEM